MCSNYLHIFIGITPQQVAQQPCVRHVRRSHDTANLLHALQIRTEAAVAAKYLAINYGGDRQAVKTVGERFPQFDVVPPFAFVKESWVA